MYFYIFLSHLFSVKADPSQKSSEEAESAAGLGPDLTASVETTYSEQSSSSAGSSSSTDQPIYFRYVTRDSDSAVTNIIAQLVSDKERLKMSSGLFLPLCYFQGVPFHLWSAYLVGLSWQTCRHWTGDLSVSYFCQRGQKLKIKNSKGFLCVRSRTVFFHAQSVLSVSQGTFAGILIGLAQLNCSELKLKRLCCRHGYEHTPP